MTYHDSVQRYKAIHQHYERRLESTYRAIFRAQAIASRSGPCAQARCDKVLQRLKKREQVYLFAVDESLDRLRDAQYRNFVDEFIRKVGRTPSFMAQPS